MGGFNLFWQAHYKKWMNSTNLDSNLKTQLLKLQYDKKLLEDCFYKHLEFGTGGIRGEFGPGINRINIYTIRRVAKGLAYYIEEHGEEAKRRGIVIAYDSRYKSEDFAIETAKTLGVHGIQTYVFESLRTTPELSFAVRYLDAFGGVVITASHNPPEYNGFKVYGSDGAQLSSSSAQKISEKIWKVDDELDIEVAEEQFLKQKGLLKIIGDDVDQAYLTMLHTITVDHHVIKQVGDKLIIVYTPLHGTGNIPVQKGLEQAGFKQVHVVEEQANPDPSFSTVKSPNPEEHAAFELAIQYGEKYDADILLATDPDADRVGVAVRDVEGNFIVLTGNQVGSMLLNYLIQEKRRKGTLKENHTVIKTIVTSEMGRDIAASHGLETIDTLTGFKYISEWIKSFEETNTRRFLFGYEESSGYLISDFVRDKDAVQTCLLVAEVAAYYKSNNKTMYQGLLELYERYGYYYENQESIILKGKDGKGQIDGIMEDFRIHPPIELAGRRVLEIEDYLERVRLFVNSGTKEAIDLPQSNVMKFKLENEAWFCLRPSGTEPKVKLYFGAREKDKEKSEEIVDGLCRHVMERVRKVIRESMMAN